MSRTLECKECGAPVHNVNNNTVSVVCWECVNKMMREHEEPTKKKQSTAQGYPKGWRFMKEFIHANGTVYHRGVEQPSLFGTLEPTPIIVKPKKSKAQKVQEKAKMMSEYALLKKQLKKETRKTVIRRIESKLKKLQKHL